MSTHHIEATPRGPDGRPRFWWYASPSQAGTPRVTVVEAHVDGLAAGHVHAGADRDYLLGVDLWSSYLYACGVLTRQPDPMVTPERQREAILNAAQAVVHRQLAAARAQTLAHHRLAEPRKEA